MQIVRISQEMVAPQRIKLLQSIYCLKSQVVLLTNSSAGAVTTFYGMPGLFGAQLQRSPNATLRLAVAEPLDACSAGVARQHGQRTALLAVRGNCSFADKARIAQRAGAELLIVYDTQPGEWTHCIARAFEAHGSLLCSMLRHGSSQ